MDQRFMIGTRWGVSAVSCALHAVLLAQCILPIADVVDHRATEVHCFSMQALIGRGRCRPVFPIGLVLRCANVRR